MGILLTTTTKQTPPVDVFTSGKFAKTIVQDVVDTTKPAPAEDIPFPAYLCAVKFGDKTVGLFQSLTGIEISRAVEPLKQGGENEFSRELPGDITYGHLTLKSGYSTSTLFFDWMLAGQEIAHPIYKDIDVLQGWPDAKLKTVKMGRQWTFVHAFPVKWNITDFSVDDVDKILIESIEISYDYFKITNIP